MNKRGVTLIELIVVIAIIGILAVALAFNYQNWMGRYNIEKAVKDLYSDLMSARAEAVMKDHTYIVNFPSVNSYGLTEDTDDTCRIDNCQIGAGDTPVATFPKALAYTMNTYTYNGAVITTRTITDVNINFDNKGRMSWRKPPAPPPPLFVDPQNPVDTGVISFTMKPGDPTDYVGNIGADYDCIVLSQTRINIGRMQMVAGKPVCNVR